MPQDYLSHCFRSIAPGRLAGVLLLSTVVGCESSSGPEPARGRPPEATKSGAAKSAGSTQSGKPASSAASSTSNSQAEPLKSTIAGDRQTVLSTVSLTKQTESSPFRFTEVAKDWGIDFVEFSGMTPDKYFPTANGSGLAIFDYDNDGLMDLYFATCTELPLGSGTRKEPNRLFKNLGKGKFKDTTEAAGVGFKGFCHGVIVGDLDNDGDQDLFLCNYGPNVLYQNNGDGTFKDISKAAGVDRSNWSSGGAMLDYDNDGYLDIYVANYGRWNYPEDHVKVGDLEKKIYLYSSPRTIKTVKHLFYHNNGNMTFTDVFDKVITVEQEEVVGHKEEEDPVTKAKKTVDVKVRKRVPHPRDDGHGFGVVAADLNEDGLVDLYVANDMNPHFLFLNLGNGTFDDVSEVSGAAFDNNGMAQSGMGVDAEDVDGDGLPELIATHFANEYATFYMNYGKGLFYDNTAFFGLASDTMPFVKWGTAFADFDNDGWPDLFISNGHVDDNRHKLNQPVDYEEIPLLFRNMQGKRFRLSTRDVGPYFDTRHVGRGAAFGDLDNDGDIDIVVNEKDRPAAVLRNDTPGKNHWVRLILQGTKSNRDAVGARIEVETGLTFTDPRKNEKKPWKIYRQRKGGVSLESANDPRVLIGVGEVAEIPKITIRWPSGAVSTLEKVKVDQDHKVVEPKDAAPAKKPG
ncbi:CRTAC1 family protein [Aquisphaera insulae]|uniref:CRTAC1 family protein n=1 Tax=Aquisphaera insulae TaxID=2712864 RepID=UPI00202E762F|nr:CRTAC1 family protein [Aquisphaera insulae]